MEWTETHDVLLLREIITSDLFKFKKGSVQRGERWEEITDNLNDISDPSFSLKDKRAVRDRWALFRKKYKSKLREEEAPSGISPDELSEKEQLIEKLIEKEESTNKADEEQKKRHWNEYSETKKRKGSSIDVYKDEDEVENKPKRQRRSEPLVDFLKDKGKEWKRTAGTGIEFEAKRTRTESACHTVSLRATTTDEHSYALSYSKDHWQVKVLRLLRKFIYLQTFSLAMLFTV